MQSLSLTRANPISAALGVPSAASVADRSTSPDMITAQRGPSAYSVFAATEDWVIVPLLKTPDAQGPGADHGTNLGKRLSAQGKAVQGVRGPVIADVNAQTGMSQAAKAAAVQAAVNTQRPNFGAGPIVKMPNGDMVVTSRVPLAKAPVIVVKLNGTTVRGMAKIEAMDNFTWSNRSGLGARQATNCAIPTT